jgi:hypothetical protein
MILIYVPRVRPVPDCSAVLPHLPSSPVRLEIGALRATKSLCLLSYQGDTAMAQTKLVLSLSPVQPSILASFEIFFLSWPRILAASFHARFPRRLLSPLRLTPPIFALLRRHILPSVVNDSYRHSARGLLCSRAPRRVREVLGCAASSYSRAPFNALDESFPRYDGDLLFSAVL